MTAIPTLSRGSYGLPAGSWRWAALGFFFLALLAAGLAVGAPEISRSVGLVLLVGIGLLALLLLYAVWPKGSLATEDAKRIAEAAARANVAWAVTGADGAVLDCNDTYRRMAGTPPGEAPPPPELALRGDSSAATLYRLARDAAAGKASEETIPMGPGVEIAAAVRPISGGRSAWWFAPRVEAGVSANRVAAPATSANVFHDAPVGMAFADVDGRLSDANGEFANFFETGTSRPIARPSATSLRVRRKGSRFRALSNSAPPAAPTAWPSFMRARLRAPNPNVPSFI
jgi:two-component system, cell cycle sensor histidine kinase and response regulator CckA